MKNFLLQSLFLLLPIFIWGQSYSWKALEAEGKAQERHENAFVQVGNKLILIGGRGQKKIDIFDTQTQQWSKGAQPPVEIHHVQAVSLDGLVYILGAFTGGWPYETPLSHVLIYDPLENIWSIGPKIPENRRRGAAGVAVYNGKIYLVNGIINGHTSGWVNWLDEFDPYTGNWEILPNSPVARDHFHAAVIDDKLFVAGGRRSGSQENGFAGTVESTNVYNFKTQTWEILPNIPTPRAGTAAGILNDNLVVLGGESDTQETAHKEVEMFDISLKEWVSLPSMMKGRHGTQAISIDNNIIIGAGSGNRGGGPELNSFEILSTEENPSIELDSLVEGKLAPATENLDFTDNANQQIRLKNSGGNQAMVISYLETDKPGTFEVEFPLPTPFVLAPGQEVNVGIRRKNMKSPSGTLYVKTLGDSKPMMINLN